MLVAFGVLGVTHTLVAWHGDGMETTRHVAVGDVQPRLAVLVLAIAAVSAVGGPERWTGAAVGQAVEHGA